MDATVKMIKLNAFKCFVLRHKKESVFCPYTKIMYNVCNKCKPKDSTNRFL